MCMVPYAFRYSTPLHDAVCCGRQEVVQILVERGANVNELDYKNMTPLRLAVRYANIILGTCQLSQNKCMYLLKMC